MRITMTRTDLEKNPNTKTTYITKEVETEELTEKAYKLITGDDTLKWFRRLGGTETAQRSYTCRGYNVTRLTSTSPDRQTKIVRTFKFQ